MRTLELASTAAPRVEQSVAILIAVIYVTANDLEQFAADEVAPASNACENLVVRVAGERF
jgi:hypothetical protein